MSSHPQALSSWYFVTFQKLPLFWIHSVAFVVLPQVHPAPQKLRSDCVFSREKGILFFSLFTPLFLCHSLFSRHKKWHLFHASDGGRMCALLLPDQKEWELQEHCAKELPTQRKKPGIFIFEAYTSDRFSALWLSWDKIVFV